MATPSEKQKKFGLMWAMIPLVLAVLVCAYLNWPQRKFSKDKTFLSDDDGVTWYAGDVNWIPPYGHNGKSAVRAVIYSYADGSKKFCGYLLRFPTDVKSRIEREAASSAGKQTPYDESVTIENSSQAEVKAPNSNGPWVPITSQNAAPVLQVKTPDGSELDQVLP